jgi:NAD(P)H-flavin reductase
LLGKAAAGQAVQPTEGNAMSALSINLETRDRVKLAGKMMVGTVVARPDSETTGEAQVGMLIHESLGNCPKYLNKKTVRAHVPSPKLVSSSLPLVPEALALIDKADMFFLSSTNGQTMDTNHRGGPPGFVRVVSNLPDAGVDGDGGLVLVYPEYSGNRLYQTLGNLHTDPRVGIVIPDFETSDVLYLAGETQLLVGPAAAALMPHTNLAVRVTVRKALFVKDGLPFRGTPGEPSPYNPPVRRLASECPAPFSQQQPTASPIATATLLRRELLTPTIARFTFRLHAPHSTENNNNNNKPLTWLPGQHVTLDFSRELNMGWSHMNDSDPQSLNDDYIRTFTISSPPPLPPPHPTEETEKEEPTTFQLTLRKHGPTTALLFSRPIRHDISPLEIPVLAISGEERFRIPLGSGLHPGPGLGFESNHHDLSGGSSSSEGRRRKRSVFVAGGVGITPLLAQAEAAPFLLAAPSSSCSSQEQEQPQRSQPQSASASAAHLLEMLWSLKAADLPFAVDVFERIAGLRRITRVFVTGGGLGGDEEGMLERLRSMGVRAERRRMARADVLQLHGAEDHGDYASEGVETKYFVCASAGMRKVVLGWLEGCEVVSESFEY